MSHQQPTDESLTGQSISSKPHSGQHFEDRGTSDTVGGNAGNDPRQHSARHGDQTLDEETVRRRAAEEGYQDPPAGKQTAKVLGMGVGMFFTTVVLMAVAIALILFFVL